MSFDLKHRYQLFDDLDDKSYRSLKDSIKEKGVLVPVEYDETGEILDGHHRVKVCNELGITEWPRFVRSGLTEEEKLNHARVLNLARRHLTKEQREKVWVDLRNSGMTLQAIADADGTTSKDTINRTLSNAKVQTPTKTKGKDGKKRPTKYKPRKPKTTYLSEETVRKAQKLPDKQQQAILSGSQKPMEAARDARLEEIVKTVNLPEAKYRIILADPPWSYGNTQPDYHTEQRDHYPVMQLADICAMNIKEITLPDAVLFLWVTSPILEESFEVIKAWGFKYKASFIWDKVKHNMGHYNSVRHEFLLVCTKGSCQPDVRKLFDSVVTEERTEHSRKPDTFYGIIEALYPSGKKIELFARGKRDGWDRFGHQA